MKRRYFPPTTLITCLETCTVYMAASSPTISIDADADAVDGSELDVKEASGDINLWTDEW